jgi:hypothetical protein
MSPLHVEAFDVPRRFKKTTIRSALTANELEAKIMELIRHREARRKIKGVEFVYVGSVGSEPNWFARPLPVPVSDACMKEFVSALAQVRKAHDLLFDTNGGATALFSESLGPVTSPGGLSSGPRSSLECNWGSSSTMRTPGRTGIPVPGWHGHALMS